VNNAHYIGRSVALEKCLFPGQRGTVVVGYDRQLFGGGEDLQISRSDNYSSTLMRTDV
jgi:hypothetical protein